jgi:hypothetical protein|tara:strand:- start:509 stop:1015 length:507 start_codon:yes stop_codon:yes gene_type:complete
MADLTSNLNYLQPTSYKLTIDRENYPNLEYFAQSVTHPGMIMNPVEMPYKQLSGIPFTGAKLTYNELSANLILDENLSSYDEMYNWMRRLLTQEEIPAIKRNFRTKVVPTYSDIVVSILSSHNNKTKQIKYIDCIPIALGDITFESTATGTEFVTFAISFRFSYFDLI